MKLAIMQPYFLPYIGYFQLINAVDKFVLYDNIQFTKKGWINRNRMLVNREAEYFTIPLKKDSDYLDVYQRKLADTYTADATKLLRQIASAYRQAPEFSTVFPVVESIFSNDEDNLFRFIYASIVAINRYLEIGTELVVSSTISIDHGLKAQDKVIAFCQAMQADTYINPIGGVDLYAKDAFKRHDIDLCFLQSEFGEYPQLRNPFVPWLSILDVMMFNSKEKIKDSINRYSLS